MPAILTVVAALFERDGRVLVAHRRRPPFAAQWVLPMTLVGADEAAEDALRRHAREQFGVGLGRRDVRGDGVPRRPGRQAAVRREHLPHADRRRADALQRRRRLRRRALAGARRSRAALDAAGPARAAGEDPDGAGVAARARTGRRRRSDRQGVPLAERERSQGRSLLRPPSQRRTTARAGTRSRRRIRRRSTATATAGASCGRGRSPRTSCICSTTCAASARSCWAAAAARTSSRCRRMGAIAVGIDQSAKQIDVRDGSTRCGTARRTRRSSRATVEDLSRFDDESFDLAVSAHALNYVERIERALARGARVLQAGRRARVLGAHPFDAALVGRCAVCASSVRTGTQHRTGRGRSMTARAARFRQWFWPVSEWFDMLTSAGFAVERMLEPQQNTAPSADATTERHSDARAVQPLIMKARKR